MPNVTDKLYYIMFYRVQLARVGFELITSVVIGTDCISSYKLLVINPTTIRSRPRWPFQSDNTDLHSVNFGGHDQNDALYNKEIPSSQIVVN
jgi:hypothetical protein